MNKIERAMVEALAKREQFYRGNTEIVYTGMGDSNGPIAIIKLYGTPIAELTRNRVVRPREEAYARPTLLTVSRLHALGIRARVDGGNLVIAD